MNRIIVIIDMKKLTITTIIIPRRNERSELVHSRMSAGKARVNTPRLAAEREPYKRLRVQGLPWGMIPFILFISSCVSTALFSPETTYIKQGWESFSVNWDIEEPEKDTFLTLRYGEEEVRPDIFSGEYVFQIKEPDIESVILSYFDADENLLEEIPIVLDLDRKPPQSEGYVQYSVSNGSAVLSWEKNADISWVIFSFEDNRIPVRIDAGEGEFYLNSEGKQSEFVTAQTADQFGNVSEKSQLQIVYDQTSPDSVDSLSAESKAKSVILSWENPESFDFNGVIISVSNRQNFAIEKDKNSYEISGLERGKEYQFSVVAVDVFGNQSEAVEISAYTGSFNSTEYSVLWESGAPAAGSIRYIASVNTVLGSKIGAVDSLLNKIIIFDQNGVIQSSVQKYGKNAGEFDQPVDILEDDNNSFFVLEKGNARVQCLSSDLKSVSMFSIVHTEDTYYPKPEAFLIQGNEFYICDSINAVVKVYSLDGKYKRSLGKGILKYPQGISVFSDGRIAVSDGSLNQIALFTETGKFIENWARYGAKKGQLIAPEKIQIFDDKLYVMDEGNRRIQVFSNDGKPEGNLFYKAEAGNIIAYPSVFRMFANDTMLIADNKKRILNLYSAEGDLLDDYSSALFAGEWDFKNPAAVSFSEFENRVYVLDSGNHRVVILNAETGDPLFSFSGKGHTPGLLYQPKGLVIADDELFISNSSKNHIQVFSLDGEYLRLIESSGSQPAFKSTGDLFYIKNKLLLVDPLSASIFSFDSQDKGSGYLSAKPDKLVPGGIAMSNKFFFLSNTVNHKIELFSLSGDYLGSFGGFGFAESYFYAPRALIVDDGGNLYVCDDKNGRVQKFDSENKFLVSIPGPDKSFNPVAVAAAPDGRLFVADSRMDRVVAYQAE